MIGAIIRSDPAAIDSVDIEIAIAVVVEKSPTSPHRFGEMAFFTATILVMPG